MLTSPFRKAAFPSKYCPWIFKALQDLDKPISSPYKHHLNLIQSTSKAALYMKADTVGMGLHRLSDQILMDKWAMIWSGLHADQSTRIATKCLLHRAFRIGQSSSDTGYSAQAFPTSIPQFLTGLLEQAQICGLSLCKGGLSTLKTFAPLPKLSTFLATQLLRPDSCTIDSSLFLIS